MVLQLHAESICAFTTFVFSPCIRCRFAEYFLANCGVVSHSVTNPSFHVCVFRDKIGLLLSSLSSWSTPADAREVDSDTAFC